MDRFTNEQAAIDCGYTPADGTRMLYKHGDFAVWIRDRTERGSTVKTFALSLWTGVAWCDYAHTQPVRLRDGTLVPMFPPGVYSNAELQAKAALVAGM